MRVQIKKDEVAHDSFTVNNVTGNLVTGLTNLDFTKYLYNPNGTEVSGTISVTITELGNGVYRASFTPDIKGEWVLLIVNSTYFSHGKSENYLCVENLLDDAVELIKRILGLTQENFRIFNPSYDANGNLTDSTIRIYENSSDCNNDVNSVAEYIMTAVYDVNQRMSSYKVIKV